MKARITDAQGAVTDADGPAITTALHGKTFFWLDLDGLDEDASQLLRDGFKFHPLAIEDAEHFGQRPKIEQYDGFSYFVVHGAQKEDPSATEEVHLFFAKGYVVTIHHGSHTLLEAVRKSLSRRSADSMSPPEVAVLYLVVDRLVDSFFPVLSEFDDRIDDIEDEILKAPTEDQLGSLFQMKRTLVTYRKVVTPQRDMFATVLSGVNVIPGMTADDERYFRDLYDHLIRVSDLVDSYRDLLTGAMDTHISTVSNRLNVVMKQLAIIATIFLPLSFLTGFFGQNFAVLINGPLSTEWGFWFLGIGSEVLAVAGLLLLFKKRGWLDGPTT